MWPKPENWQIGVKRLKELPASIRCKVNGHLSANQVVSFLRSQTLKRNIHSQVDIERIKERLRWEVEPRIIDDDCLFGAKEHGIGPPTIDRLLPIESIPSRRQIPLDSLLHTLSHIVTYFAIARLDGKSSKKKTVYEEAIVEKNFNRGFSLWIVIGERVEKKRLESITSIVSEHLGLLLQGKNPPSLDEKVCEYYARELQET